jgi:hypothetical protein
MIGASRSRWLHGVKRGSSVAGLLGLRVRIPGGDMDVSSECCILCVWLITSPEESCRVWCVFSVVARLR